MQITNRSVSALIVYMYVSGELQLLRKPLLLKVRFVNIETKSTNHVLVFLRSLIKCLIIDCTDLKTRRESLWKLKTTKNEVPKSDIEYMSMISTDFDGD